MPPLAGLRHSSASFFFSDLRVDTGNTLNRLQHLSFGSRKWTRQAWWIMRSATAEARPMDCMATRASGAPTLSLTLFPLPLNHTHTHTHTHTQRMPTQASGLPSFPSRSLPSYCSLPPVPSLPLAPSRSLPTVPVLPFPRSRAPSPFPPSLCLPSSSSPSPAGLSRHLHAICARREDDC